MLWLEMGVRGCCEEVVSSQFPPSGPVDSHFFFIFVRLAWAFVVWPLKQQTQLQQVKHWVGSPTLLLTAKKAEVRAAWCSCSVPEKQGIVCSAAGCAHTARLIAQPRCFGHCLPVLSLSCKQVKTVRGKCTNFGGHNLEACKLHLSAVSGYWDWWYNFWVY